MKYRVMRKRVKGIVKCDILKNGDYVIGKGKVEVYKGIVIFGSIDLSKYSK